MADSIPKLSPSIDLRSGFCSSTRIFHSLRPQPPLPESDMSVANYVFSLLKPELINSKLRLIDAQGEFVSYSELVTRAEGLAAALQWRIGLQRGDVAFVMSGNSVHIPVLYLALLLIGVVVSPSNPMSRRNEIERQLKLCNPVIAFATNLTGQKIPELKYGTVLIDLAVFKAMMMPESGGVEQCGFDKVSQSDPATLLYSSGTTGRVKGVVFTHSNYIAMLAGSVATKQAREKPAVMFCTVPYFHVYGLVVMLRSLAFGESLVCMERMDMEVMMCAVERFKVTHVAAAPPLVAALARSVEVGRPRNDLNSLEVVSSGGAPLREGIVVKFRRLFPNVQLAQP